MSNEDTPKVPKTLLFMTKDALVTEVLELHVTIKELQAELAAALEHAREFESSAEDAWMKKLEAQRKRADDADNQNKRLEDAVFFACAGIICTPEDPSKAGSWHEGRLRELREVAERAEKLQLLVNNLEQETRQLQEIHQEDEWGLKKRSIVAEQRAEAAEALVKNRTHLLDSTKSERDAWKKSAKDAEASLTALDGIFPTDFCTGERLDKRLVHLLTQWVQAQAQLARLRELYAELSGNVRLHGYAEDLVLINEIDAILAEPAPTTEAEQPATQATESEAGAQVKYVDIVFDAGPGPESGRFVEVEDMRGVSISLGEWVKRNDSYWALRIPDPREVNNVKQ